jgi:hypothetical protein
MKRLSEQVTNYADESPQTSYAKMARRSPSRFHYEDQHRQEISMDQRVVRQDLFYFLEGIFSKIEFPLTIDRSYPYFQNEMNFFISILDRHVSSIFHNSWFIF